MNIRISHDLRSLHAENRMIVTSLQAYDDKMIIEPCCFLSHKCKAICLRNLPRYEHPLYPNQDKRSSPWSALQDRMMDYRQPRLTQAETAGAAKWVADIAVTADLVDRVQSRVDALNPMRDVIKNRNEVVLPTLT
jgi:hypothetical protein